MWSWLVKRFIAQATILCRRTRRPTKTTTHMHARTHARTHAHTLTQQQQQTEMRRKPRYSEYSFLLQHFFFLFKGHTSLMWIHSPHITLGLALRDWQHCDAMCSSRGQNPTPRMHRASSCPTHQFDLSNTLTKPLFHPSIPPSTRLTIYHHLPSTENTWL